MSSVRYTTNTMGRLTLRTKAGFGVGDLGGNLFFTVSGFYFLFYLTDIVHLDARVAGTILMVAKVWDAVTDPAVGYLSDVTITRWGRRRPYLIAGSFLIIVALMMLFTPPPAVPVVWVLIATCLANTAYTCINIPYGALTPEITNDYHQRTVLNGWRMSFAVVGSFVGAAAILPLVKLFGGGPAGWNGMGLAIGAVIALSTLVVVVTIDERPLTSRPSISLRAILRSYREVLTQRTFLLALLPWALHITGINVIQGALLYYFRVIYQDEGAFQIALPILLGSAIVSIPAWVMISKRIGKRASYNIGMSIFAISVITFFAIGHTEGPIVAYIVMAIAGTGFATQYVMPFAILPDVVDADYAETGVKREGVYYGLWTFASKLGQAVALNLTGWVLHLANYSEGAPPIAQPPSALMGIRLLTGPIPALFFGIGVVVLRRYPITPQRYLQIQARIATRKQ